MREWLADAKCPVEDAWRMIKKGDFIKSDVIIDKHLFQNPDDPWALLLKGYLNYKDNDCSKACINLRKAYEGLPHISEVRFLLIKALENDDSNEFNINLDNWEAEWFNGLGEKSPDVALEDFLINRRYVDFEMRVSMCYLALLYIRMDEYRDASRTISELISKCLSCRNCVENRNEFFEFVSKGMFKRFIGEKQTSVL
jgi:hypothetical protein